MAQWLYAVLTVMVAGMSSENTESILLTEATAAKEDVHLPSIADLVGSFACIINTSAPLVTILASA